MPAAQVAGGPVAVALQDIARDLERDGEHDGQEDAEAA